MPQEPTSPRRRRRAPSGTPRRLTLVNPQIRVEDPENDEASPEEVTAPGSDTTQAEDHHATEDYFTAEEREGLAHWRAIVADMPPMTQEEIERVAAIFRRNDARRKAA